MTPTALSTLATGYWPAAMLIAAVQLSVFDALPSQPRTAADIAATIGVSVDRLTALLDALVSMALLRKIDDAYDIAGDVRPLLSRASPTCMLDALAYNADLYRHWSNLAAVVRGEASPMGSMQLGADPAMTRRFVLGMDAKARAFAPALAAAIDVGEVRTILDIGAGPGTVTRRLLEDRPMLSATLLDLSPVLNVSREICATSPVINRLTFYPADYRTDPLPLPFDAVLYAGALHQETPASAATLFGRLRQSLVAGGRLFVVDLMLDDDRTTPPFSAMFQLNMMLLRPGSRVFTSGETAAILSEAGFSDIGSRDVAQTPYRLVTATRE